MDQYWSALNLHLAFCSRLFSKSSSMTNNFQKVLRVTNSVCKQIRRKSGVCVTVVIASDLVQVLKCESATHRDTQSWL